MLLFSDVLYMLVRYASPSGPMCLRCLMLTLSDPVELLFMFVKVMSYGGVVGYFGVLAFCVSFVSCIVMMSGWVLCTSFLVP